MTPTASPDISTDTRARILAHAEQLFAEKDFAGTGIGEIAKRAGIAKSVIYHYFKSKDEILKTLIDDFIDEAVELNRQLPEKLGLFFLQGFQPFVELFQFVLVGFKLFFFFGFF